MALSALGLSDIVLNRTLYISHDRMAQADELMQTEEWSGSVKGERFPSFREMTGQKQMTAICLNFLRCRWNTLVLSILETRDNYILRQLYYSLVRCRRVIICWSVLSVGGG